jgi:YggT family protein
VARRDQTIAMGFTGHPVPCGIGRGVMWLIDLYSLVVLVAAILSWVPVDPRNPLVTMARGLTEPVLAPICKVLPPMGGLDVSPMVLLVALQLLKGFLY